MPYYQIIPNTDNRASRAIVPVDLVNAFVQPNTEGAQARSKYIVGPTPGRTRRLELPANVRGLYARPGVQSGAPFVVAGTTLYSISNIYAATNIGTVSGGDIVQFAPFRTALSMLGGGQIKVYDSGTLNTVTDPDAPSSPGGLTQAAYRLIAFETGGDAFAWSKAALYNDWDPFGVAADFDLPDPIVGQDEQGGDLVSFNAESIQRWRPTGGSESQAFSPVQSGTINFGLIGRDAKARVNGGIAFIDHRRVPRWIADGGIQEWSSRALSDDLLALTPAARAAGIGWGYSDGEMEFFGLRFPGMESAYVRDISTRLWHQRRRYGRAQYDVAFSAPAFDTVLCAGPASPYVWSFDRKVYTDDGDPIVRVMTVKADLPEDVTISSLCIDIRCVDYPASGQGSAPVMMLEYSRDGGSTWSSSWGDQRTVPLPRAGDDAARPVEWQFGLFPRQYGAMFRMTFSEPIGFALQGAWINGGFR